MNGWSKRRAEKKQQRRQTEIERLANGEPVSRPFIGPVSRSDWLYFERRMAEHTPKARKGAA